MNDSEVLAIPSPITHKDTVELLRETSDDAIEAIRQTAEAALLTHCGDNVYLRGLIEFSNECRLDCYYCGIRKSAGRVRRYTLSLDAILKSARRCAAQGYGSLVLQSGERRDEAFVSRVVEIVRRIKKETRSARQPNGLGITLCVGEQTPETYRRFFEAGAHRYLLRVETSNPRLFAKIHPSSQTLNNRIACLDSLRKAGFIVGAGVMIGLPGQTVEDLANDIDFFREQDVDMIGMGPYIPHEDAPLARESCPDDGERLRLGLLMIAAARLALKDVNIAATTALHALHPFGREKGLRFGANVLMPQVTPIEFQRDYLLYPGKPCLDESATICEEILESRIRSLGRTIGYYQWGDPIHARRNSLNDTSRI